MSKDGITIERTNGKFYIKPEKNEIQHEPREEPPIRYRINFDLSAALMEVWLEKPPPVELDMIMDEDGEFRVHYLVMPDGLPKVYKVDFLHPVKLGIIHDWIDEGIEDALENLEIDGVTDFSDHCHRGTGALWTESELTYDKEL
jgi:hypothetical protein